MTSFTKWYATHKLELAAKRKKRYESDPVYREKAIKNAANYRVKQQSQIDPVPVQYTFTLSLTAKALGVAVTTLRKWQEKGYFPVPYEYRGRMYFTDNQVGLLKGLVKFMRGHGRSLTTASIRQLSSMTDFLTVNWG